MTSPLNSPSKEPPTSEFRCLSTQKLPPIKKTDHIITQTATDIIKQSNNSPLSSNRKNLKQKPFHVYGRKDKLILLDKLRKWRKQPAIFQKKKRPNFSNYTAYNLRKLPPLLKPFADKMKIKKTVNKDKKESEKGFNSYLGNPHSFNKKFQ
jgi:hypothetical protein